VYFQADYDEIQLQKYSYDMIIIKPSKNVTKIMSQFFSNMSLSQSKFLASVEWCLAE